MSQVVNCICLNKLLKFAIISAEIHQWKINQLQEKKKLKIAKGKLSFLINIWNFMWKLLSAKIKWNTTRTGSSELNIFVKNSRENCFLNTIKSWKCKENFYLLRIYLLCERRKFSRFSSLLFQHFAFIKRGATFNG